MIDDHGTRDSIRDLLMNIFLTKEQRKKENMLTFRQLQDEQRKWAEYNFPEAEAYHSLLGSIEELAECRQALMLSLAEEWMPIQNFEGLYEVSNCGRVKRVGLGQGAKTGRILSGFVTRNGYIVVDLYHKRQRQKKLVHILVAEAFIGKKPEGFDVNHKNGVKSDNNIYNLEYLTRSDNQKHAIALGLCHPGLPPSMLTMDDISTIRKLRAQGVGIKTIMEKFDISKSTVLKVQRPNYLPVYQMRILNNTEDVLKKKELQEFIFHKITEAAGKICHHYLKMLQKIRGSEEEHLAKVKDAIADCIIFLCNYCSLMGFDLQQVMEDTWAEVKQRDWRRFPQNGKTQ